MQKSSAFKPDRQSLIRGAVIDALGGRFVEWGLSPQAQDMVPTSGISLPTDVIGLGRRALSELAY